MIWYINRDAPNQAKLNIFLATITKKMAEMQNFDSLQQQMAAILREIADTKERFSRLEKIVGNKSAVEISPAVENVAIIHSSEQKKEDNNDGKFSRGAGEKIVAHNTTNVFATIMHDNMKGWTLINLMASCKQTINDIPAELRDRVSYIAEAHILERIRAFIDSSSLLKLHFIRKKLEMFRSFGLERFMPAVNGVRRSVGHVLIAALVAQPGFNYQVGTVTSLSRGTDFWIDADGQYPIDILADHPQTPASIKIRHELELLRANEPLAESEWAPELIRAPIRSRGPPAYIEDAEDAE